MNIPTSARAIIEIGNDLFDTWEGAKVAGASVELNTDQGSAASVQFLDPAFVLMDKYAQALADDPMRADFWLTFDENPGPALFTGILSRVERGEAKTTFRFHDLGFRMRLNSFTGYHKANDPLALLRFLASRNGLKFEGPAKDFKPDKSELKRSVMQDAKTDWAMAAEVAEDAGLVLYVSGETLYAKEPAKTGTPAATFTFGQDFFLTRDFDLTYKTPENPRGRPASVEVRGRGAGGARLSGKSEVLKRGAERVHIKRSLTARGGRSARQRAEAKRRRQRERVFDCSIRYLPVPGAPRVNVRDTVGLAGVGRLFSGLYLVDRAAYRFEPGRLEADFELYRDIEVRS